MSSQEWKTPDEVSFQQIKKIVKIRIELNFLDNSTTKTEQKEEATPGQTGQQQ